jgi:hypothetical protein
MKLNSISMFLLFTISAAFSQEAQEPIKFQINSKDSGAPVAAAPIVQSAPLNLQALTAKDSENFEDYSKRYSLIEDSISATYKAIEAAKKQAEAGLPPLKPKGEFEKQAEADARAVKYNAEIASRIEKDAKPLNARLAELQKAKAKILENQISLYGSLDIKSNPSAASVWVGKEEIGTTPAEYKLLIPGTVKIRLQKEGYNPWDTTLQAAPMAKLKLDVVLEEKSIYSQKNEISFSQILSKDTTVQGYEARIKRVKARKVEINKEIKQILENFQSNYPALEPQRNGETAKEFEERREERATEMAQQFVELQKKHDAYNRKLTSSITVLNDYIVATQSSLFSEIAVTAKISLGEYNSEAETFEFTAQDTVSRKSPFYFNGKVGVPLEAAKNLNRKVPGFIAGLQFINFPFNADSASVNLAMSGLQFSMNGQDLKVNGSFSEIERYKSMEGYNAWKLRADSLLSGKLKAYGLDYAYLDYANTINTAAAGDAAKSESKGTDGLGWRGITRIIAFSAAAISGAAAIYKHSESKNNIEELNSMKHPDYNNVERWKEQYNVKADEVKSKEKQRNIFGALAGVCAFSGVVTFFF